MRLWTRISRAGAARGASTGSSRACSSALDAVQRTRATRARFRRTRLAHGARRGVGVPHGPRSARRGPERLRAAHVPHVDQDPGHLLPRATVRARCGRAPHWPRRTAASAGSRRLERAGIEIRVTTWSARWPMCSTAGPRGRHRGGLALAPRRCRPSTRRPSSGTSLLLGSRTPRQRSASSSSTGARSLWCRTRCSSGCARASRGPGLHGSDRRGRLVARWALIVPVDAAPGRRREAGCDHCRGRSKRGACDRLPTPTLSRRCFGSRASWHGSDAHEMTTARGS